jgi:hypothetical protein
MTNELIIETTASSQKRHRASPIPESITYISGYPEKLFIYQLEASKYWWARYYISGKIVRRSTKTDNKKLALEAAKAFYNELNHRVHSGT